MKTVGLIGGLGPESTIDYYRRIIALWQRQHGRTAPRILIDSLDVDHALRLVATDREALARYLAESAQRLVSAGADFIALTANTPHIVFDAVAQRVSVPLVSIVEVCATNAQRHGLSRLLLLGTRFTMEASFYPEVCARHQISVVAPNESDRTWIHSMYVDELLRGHFEPARKEALAALVESQRASVGIDGVILGGTELPLLVGDASLGGLPTLDTTALHVAAIVDRLST